MIADDNSDELVLLKEMVYSIDPKAQISTVSDGQQAFDACTKPDHAAFDLVVLDYYLPVKTAKEVVLQLSAIEGKSPLRVVVLSSYLSSQEQESLLKLGATLVLQKPADYDGYLVLARRLIELARR